MRSARSGSPGRALFLYPPPRSCEHSSPPSRSFCSLVAAHAIARRAAARDRVSGRDARPGVASVRGRASTSTACAARRCRCSCPCGRRAATRRWTSRGTSRSSARPTPLAGRSRWDKTDGSRWVVQHGRRRAVRSATACSPTSSRARSACSIRRTPTGTARRCSCTSRAQAGSRDAGRRATGGLAGRSTATRARANQTHFRFENYDRLIDTPTEVAPAVLLDSFVVDGRQYRTMVHHNGPRRPRVRAALRAATSRRSSATRTPCSSPPPLEQYTFLFNIGYAGGDGMEHLYSTQIINSRHLGRLDRRAARAQHGGARVLPRLERQARAPGGARTVRLHARAVPAEPLGGRRVDAVLRHDARSDAPAS